jgi:hypothetical protein
LQKKEYNRTIQIRHGRKENQRKYKAIIRTDRPRGLKPKPKPTPPTPTPQNQTKLVNIKAIGGRYESPVWLSNIHRGIRASRSVTHFYAMCKLSLNLECEFM